MSEAVRRKHFMPFGAAIEASGGVHFRLWAPEAGTVELCLAEPPGPARFLTMERGRDGWHELRQESAAVGSHYRFRLDRELLVPDPASRCQAGDVHGWSVVVDPLAFAWRDGAWAGRPWEEAIIYELHVGTFTERGDFTGVAERLDYLVDLGITAVELMPVADFPGTRNWGYDAVLLFAPETCYGTPEQLKSLIQEAHARNLMVFLDVVYNHFGPEGNYLHSYARQAFFSGSEHTPWGEAINFAGAGSKTVRDFFRHNALYWLNEYHIDGLRFDAAHAIFDRSSPDILEEIATAVREGPGRQRHIHLILENDANEAHYLERAAEGEPCHYTAQWNDDFHHTCHVLLSGERDGYYTDYTETPLHHLGRCLTQGFAYQGEASAYRQQRPRGARSAHLPLTAFVCFLQNHDQIGNRALGERLHELAPAALLEIALSLLLLSPSPPLLFMGEEVAAATPFLYFCDFQGELADGIAQSRWEELSRRQQSVKELSRQAVADPNDPATFTRSQLRWQQPPGRKALTTFQRYQRLLALRAREIVPRLRGLQGHAAAYELLSPSALQVTWRLGDGSVLLAVSNFSPQPLVGVEADWSSLLYVAPEQSENQRLLRRGILPATTIVWFLLARSTTNHA